MSMDSEGTQDASIFIYTYYILITHAKYSNYYTHVSPVHTNIFLTTLHIYEDCARGVSARIRFIFIPCNRRNYKWLWYLIELCESCNYLRDYYGLFFHYVSFFSRYICIGLCSDGKRNTIHSDPMFHLFSRKFHAFHELHAENAMLLHEWVPVSLYCYSSRQQLRCIILEGWMNYAIATVS